MALWIFIGILVLIAIILITFKGLMLCNKNNAIGVLLLFIALNIFGLIWGIAILWNNKNYCKTCLKDKDKIKIRTIFNDAKALKEKLEEYFNHCKQTEEVPTKVGMLVYLDITENTLYSWKQKKRNTFLQQINWAYLQIRHINTQRYLKANANNTAWYLERAFVKEYHLSTKLI